MLTVAAAFVGVFSGAKKLFCGKKSSAKIAEPKSASDAGAQQDCKLDALHRVNLEAANEDELQIQGIEEHNQDNDASGLAQS